MKTDQERIVEFMRFKAYHLEPQHRNVYFDNDDAIKILMNWGDDESRRIVSSLMDGVYLIQSNRPDAYASAVCPYCIRHPLRCGECSYRRNGHQCNWKYSRWHTLNQIYPDFMDRFAFDVDKEKYLAILTG